MNGLYPACMLCATCKRNQRAGCRLDTFHLASCYEGSEAEGGSNGCDISHRGGPPGFVQLQGEGTLVWADYVGNYTFTSLGEAANLP